MKVQNKPTITFHLEYRRSRKSRWFPVTDNKNIPISLRGTVQDEYLLHNTFYPGPSDAAIARLKRRAFMGECDRQGKNYVTGLEFRLVAIFTEKIFVYTTGVEV